MFALIAIIQIVPQHRETFFKAQSENAEASVRDEPGCLGFHVLQGVAHGSPWDPQTDEFDPNRMVVYEMFEDRAAFEAHLEAPHYARYREKVKGMRAAPNVVYYFNNFFPDDSYFAGLSTL